MMGNDSIDVGLENIWRSWFVFRKGKRQTSELHEFQYSLEKNLFELYKDLSSGTYHHGGYKKFVVSDNKRREISIAGIRDRIVHRLVYDYLVPIYDKTFIYDAWSCRKNKGLLGGIERAQFFLHRYSRSFVWKGDVKKFFDNVNHAILIKIIWRKIKDKKALELITKIIQGFNTHTHTHTHTHTGRGRGMAIGNLTSQIFANIYLNEFDRFAKHVLKPKAYLRYGDDFIMVEPDIPKLNFMKEQTVDFLNNILKLQVNPKSDKIFKAQHGLKFLGVILWPSGRKLNKRNSARIYEKLTPHNASSYCGVLQHHANRKKLKEFHWMVHEKMI